jgi:hypothetical protein
MMAGLARTGNGSHCAVIGAGLLFATGAIHLDLYFTGYRTIPTIGWLFLFQVITAFGLGAIILVSNSRLAAAAGAGFVMVDHIALYAAQYSSTSTALADLEAVERLHREKFVGSFDAAVTDKENGKPHIVKRMDRPIAPHHPRGLRQRKIAEEGAQGCRQRAHVEYGGTDRGGRADGRERHRHRTDWRRQGRQALHRRLHRRDC